MCKGLGEVYAVQMHIKCVKWGLGLECIGKSPQAWTLQLCDITLIDISANIEVTDAIEPTDTPLTKHRYVLNIKILI